MVVEVELQVERDRIETSAREPGLQSQRGKEHLTWRTSWLSLKTMTCFIRR